MIRPSTRLVEYLLSLTEADIGPELERKAVTALLDNLGCGLYGAHQQWGQIVNDLVLSEQSRGAATLYGCEAPVAPVRAALANGTSTHGFEFDDLIQSAVAHPGAVVVPSALAAAEQSGESGARLLLAIVAGYEMMGRLGRALGTEHGVRGFHTTGIAGPVAAAVAAGVVMRLDLPKMLAAIGIACSSASGIKAFTQGTGGMVKRMHAGRAAEAGVLACELARLGFTGPTEGIDGQFGLLQVIGGTDARAGELDERLGKSFEITQVWVKVYPCCGGIHSAVHALESLRRQHRIDPAHVERVHVHTNSRVALSNGDRDPQETMAAQYSMPFTAGVALTRDPRDAAAYSAANLRDPAVRALMTKVTMSADPDIERLLPDHFAARVNVTLKGGRELEELVLDPNGSLGAPCTPADVEAKFRRLAGTVKRQNTVDRIIIAVRNMAKATSLSELSSALREGE
jgi:2-methylcitrate dehydratase PrpD